MITSSIEDDYTTNEEGNTVDGKNPNAPTSSITSWSRLKDPRIVRVSRAFGGKDRHSKVCTVRGLRDRRVRLSVPTAIQLYDLQDRLGVNQPSKVVDWLLNAAKHEIDELPPLQIPLGSFDVNCQALFNHGLGSSSQTSREENKNNNANWDGPMGIPTSDFWNSDDKTKEKSKELEEEANHQHHEKEKQGAFEGNHTANVSPGNFFPGPSQSHSSIPGLLNNVIPYSSFFRRDASSFGFSHIGRHGYANPTENTHNSNVVPLPSNLSLPSGSHQVLVCPPGTAQSYFPSHVPAPIEFDPKQMNHFQISQNPTLYSIGQSMRPLHLSMAPRSDNNDGFPPK